MDGGCLRCDLRLAPFYDLLCTAVYPTIDTKLAMVIGEHSDPGKIRGRDWRQLAEGIQVNPTFVVDTVRDLAENIPERTRTIAAQLRERYGDLPATQMILRVLRKRARRVLALLEQ